MSGLRAEFAVQRPDFRLDLALDVPAGRTTALLGPNGAGKSTALAVLAGLLAPARGFVALGERIVDDPRADVHVDPAQRRVGMVFQGLLLFPHLDVRDNIAFPARVRTGSRADGRRHAEEWIARFGLEHLRHKFPHELSGGQAQRVALARALAGDPEVLLLDEPMSALDAQVREESRIELARHVRAFGGATVLVTHSIADARSVAHDVVVLEHGQVTQRGTIADLALAPATDYIAQLVRGEPD